MSTMKKDPTLTAMVVPFADIEFGDRRREDYVNIEHLADSILESGLLNPLTCCRNPDPSGKPYLLLAGGRRYIALERLQMEEVQINLTDEEPSSYQRRKIELIENLQRENLTMAEELALVEEIDALYKQEHGEKKSTSPDAPGWSTADTASLLGRARSGVSQDLKLAKAMKVIPELRGCKTKDEAHKMLKKMEIQVLEQTLAKKIETEAAKTPTESIKRDLCARYINNDFFEGARSLDDKAFNLIEIDPPYGIDLTNVKKAPSEVTMDYNEVPAEGYADFLDRTLKIAYSKLSNDGWLILWYGADPWANVCYELLVANGFLTTRVPAIWVKGGPGQTRQPDKYLAASYETFYYARKGNPFMVKPGRSNVFTFAAVPPGNKKHPTQRPIGLMTEILSTFADRGSRILVPFLGSGTTILAANNLGMTALGFDLSPEYRNSFILRVNEGTPGNYKDF